VVIIPESRSARSARSSSGIDIASERGAQRLNARGAAELPHMDPVSKVVAGGRFELYSKHLIQIQAVAASIDVPVDLRTNGFLKKVERDGPHCEH